VEMLPGETLEAWYYLIRMKTLHDIRSQLSAGEYDFSRHASIERLNGISAKRYGKKYHD